MTGRVALASLFVLLAITVVGIDGPAFARYEPTVANDAAQWHDWAFWASSPESLRNLALIVGGFLAATVGLWLAAVRTLAVHRSSKVAEKRQVTEAFTTATGQLGASNDLEVRHGAIYAQGELARTAPSMHWPIMETLSVLRKGFETIDCGFHAANAPACCCSALTCAGVI